MTEQEKEDAKDAQAGENLFWLMLKLGVAGLVIFVGLFLVGMVIVLAMLGN